MSQQSSSKTSFSNLTKSAKTLFYGDKGPLGVYANNNSNLTPTAELNIAKDYNKKINNSTCDNEMLKNNISLLSSKNPTFVKTDTLTLTSYLPSPFRARIKMTPLSDIDNVKHLMSSQLVDTQMKRRDSLINYESIDKAWKSSVKKINLTTSESTENFDVRQRKQVLSISTSNNPLLGEGISPKSNNRIRISSPLSSYAPNLESKRLLQYEYGQNMSKETQDYSIKSVQPPQKVVPREDTDRSDFRRKKSTFDVKGTILRGAR